MYSFACIPGVYPSIGWSTDLSTGCDLLVTVWSNMSPCLYLFPHHIQSSCNMLNQLDTSLINALFNRLEIVLPVHWVNHQLVCSIMSGYSRYSFIFPCKLVYIMVIFLYSIASCKVWWGFFSKKNSFPGPITG